MITKEYYNLGKIEILSKDVIIERNKNPNVPIEYRQWSKLTFDEAEQIAEEMGNGWRIPTMEVKCTENTTSGRIYST